LIEKEAQALKAYTANKHKLLFTWSIIGAVACAALFILSLEVSIW